MKVVDVMRTVAELRGQQYSGEMMIGWLNEIEGQVIEDIINQADGYDKEFVPIVWAKDDEMELVVPERFKDLYVNYLLSKIDFYNQETERYNNDVVMFNAALDDYSRWFIRHHMPKPAVNFSRF